MDLNLKNKIALITGSSVGIGEAVAEQFAKEGVDLILCSRNKNNIEKVANELQIKYSIKAKGLSIDLTNKKSFNILDNFIMDEFGGVDILINNAGTGTNETIMEAEDEKWQYNFKEVLENLQELVKAGKIRHIGLSNETAYGLSRFLEESRLHDLPKMITVQNPYSLLNRKDEIGLTEVLHRQNAGLLPYSPLGMGTLSGKHLNGIVENTIDKF